MDLQFGNVQPGIALSAGDATRLKDEIKTVLEAIGSLKVGGYCNIKDFKRSDGAKLALSAQITQVTRNTATVDLKYMS